MERGRLGHFSISATAKGERYSRKHSPGRWKPQNTPGWSFSVGLIHQQKLRGRARNFQKPMVGYSWISPLTKTARACAPLARATDILEKQRFRHRSARLVHLLMARSGTRVCRPDDYHIKPQVLLICAIEISPPELPQRLISL